MIVITVIKTGTRASIELTALSVHFNQECSDSHFAGWNGEIEEEDGNPGEEKEVV